MRFPSARVLFRRELARQSCAIPEISEEYDLPLHIGALFIILAVSFLACAFPIVAVGASKLRIPPTFLFVVRHFGTGVLIATAFVHLLPTAFISLTDPCLPSFWNETYPAMAGALALAAVFLIVVIEMVFSPGKNCCAFPGALVDRGDKEAGRFTEVSGGVLSGADGKKKSKSSSCQDSLTILGAEPMNSHVRVNSTGAEAATCREQPRTTDKGSHPDKQKDSNKQLESTLTPLETEQRHKKALMQCLLLELGILFHSVFIGMALSVATGNDFIVLLIAISFHREYSPVPFLWRAATDHTESFEGLALGARIATLTWKPHACQPWLMALAYGCTLVQVHKHFRAIANTSRTPIGQAIGLATHTLYTPGSQTGLLMVGIMNAISAGLLTFTSIADLIAEDFLSDESWRMMRGRRRVSACFLVFAGAFGMSMIGAWA